MSPSSGRKVDDGNQSMTCDTALSKSFQHSPCQFRPSSRATKRSCRFLLQLVILVSFPFLSSSSKPVGKTPVPSCQPCFGRCSCFVNSQKLCTVDCSYVDLGAFPGLESLPDPSTISKLLLVANAISYLPTDELGEFSNLITLDLSKNNLTSEMLENADLPSINTLNYLSLSWNPLKTLHAKTFLFASNLQSLYLENCDLSTIDKQAFTPLNKLKNIYLSDNTITSLSEETFSPLVTSIQIISLSNNNISKIPSNMLSGLPNLQQLYLDNNPWSCKCDDAWFSAYMNDLIDKSIISPEVAAITSCASPWQLKGHPVHNLTYYCDPGQYVSCAGTGLQAILVEYAVVYDGISSAEGCNSCCFQYGGAYYSYVSDRQMCYCGYASQRCDSCQAEIGEKATGESFCERTYLQGVVGVSTGLSLQGTRPYTTLEDVQLTAASSVHPTEYAWTINDGVFSQSFTTSTSSLSYSPVLPGNLHVSLCIRAGNGTANISSTIPLLQPVTLALVTAPEYADVDVRPEVKVKLSSGSEASMLWSVADENGTNEIQGKFCASSWTPMNEYCIQRKSWVKATYTGAGEACGQQGASLLIIRDDVELATAQSILEPGNNYYIGAKKSASGVYIWQQNSETTFFSSHNITTSDAGDCVTLTSQGLQGVPCEVEYEYLCQKNSELCPYGGVYEESTHLCYLVSGSMLTWAEANEQCGLVTDRMATLAMPTSNQQLQTLSSVLQSEMNIEYWIGLSNIDKQSQYTWVSGRSLFLSPAPWKAGLPDETTPTEHCITMTLNEGQPEWNMKECHSSQFYICQYNMAALTTSIYSSLTGTAEFPQHQYVSKNLTVTDSTPTSSTVLHLLPGMWFPMYGVVESWHFLSAVMDTPAELHLQVYRPGCREGFFLSPPGCTNNAYSLCVKNEPSCRTPASCAAGQSYCALTDSCTALSQPCSCVSHPTAPACVWPQTPTNASYRLVYQETAQVPAATDARMYRVQASSMPKMHAYDVLGFQIDERTKIPIRCEYGAALPWRTTRMILSTSGWASTTPYDFTNSRTSDNFVCYLRTVFTHPQTFSAPENLLSHFNFAEGIYKYRAHVENEVSSTADVAVVQMVKASSDLQLVYPISSKLMGQIIVESGVPQQYFLSLHHGQYASLRLSISLHSETPFQKDCPDTFVDGTTCQNALDNDLWFASIQDTLSGEGDIQVTFIATTPVNTVSHVVNITVEKRISGLSIHGDPAVMYLAVNTEYTLSSTVMTGSHVTYHWQNSDNNFDVVTTNSSVTRSFSLPGEHEIQLTAYNDINSLNVTKVFKVFTKANAKDLLIQVPKLLRANSECMVIAEFSLDSWSSVTLIFSFGDGNPDAKIIHTQTSKDTIVNIPYNHTYINDGTVNVTVSLQDNVDPSVMTSASQEVVILHPVSSAQIFINETTVSPGQTIMFSVQQNGGSGSMFCTWTFCDSQFLTSWTRCEENVSHTFSTSSNCKISVEVSNNISSASASLILPVVEGISGLTLIYNGPTYFGDPTEITANLTTGSHVSYEVEFSITETLTTENQMFVYTYKSMGTYNVTVRASNALGSAEAMVTVEVVEALRLRVRSIKTPPCVAVGEKVKLRAQVDNLDNLDLLYTWTIDGILISSGHSLDILEYTFTVSGVKEVKLVVDSQLEEFGSSSMTQPVCVQHRVAGLQVTTGGPFSIIEGQVIEAKLKASTTTGSDLTYLWRIDGDNITTQVNKYDLQLTEAGPHRVHVKVFNNVSAAEQDVIIQVYEPITNLSVVINSTDKYLSTDVPYSLSAYTDTGSGISYLWTVDYVRLSFLSMFSHYFSTPGTYTVAVIAENPVSRERASNKFTVQTPIQGSSLITNASGIVEAGQFVSLVADISAGSDMNFTWKMCSACKETSTTMNHLVYQFSVLGRHVVSVTVSNQISSTTLQKDLFVISLEQGFNLDLEPVYEERFVPSGTVINGSAVLGPSASFTQLNWQIYTSNSIISDSYGEYLQHTFEKPNLYNIALAGSIAGIEGNLTKLKVVEVIDPLLGIRIFPEVATVHAGDFANFSAICLQGNQYLTIGWYLGTSEYDLKLQSENTSYFFYTFATEGSYVVRVLASNPISNVSLTKNIYVIPPGYTCSVTLNIQNPPYIPVDVIISLAARCPASTDPYVYVWVIMEEPPLPPVTKFGQQTSHNFTKVGTSHISLVIMKNNLTIDAVNLEVKIQRPLEGLHIISPKTHCVVEEPCEFIAEVNKGSDVIFKWDFGNGYFANSTRTTINYTYTDAGVYQVKATASNQLSVVHDEHSVLVVKPITGLHIKDCCVNAVETDKLILFNADVESGTLVSYNWTLYEDPPVTGSSRLLTHTFSIIGERKISVTASNLIGSQTFTDIVRVEESISNLRLYSNQSFYSNIYVGEPVLFYVRISKGNPVSFSFNIDAHSSQGSSDIVITNRTERSLTLIFRTDDIYTLTVTATNNVSSAVITKDLTVKRIECQTPKLTVIGESSRFAMKSRDITLEVYVEALNFEGLPCDKYIVLHKWSIYKMDSGCPPIEEEINSSEISLPSEVGIKSPQLYLPPRVLEYGTHCVRFRSEYFSTPAHATVQLNLHILSSPLVSLITGGDERSLMDDQLIVLDGSTSYDPDLPKNVPQGLIYEWTCEPLTHGHQNDCFEDVENKSMVVLPPYTFVPGQEYQVTLTVSKSSSPRGTASYKQKLVVYGEDAPLVYIECISCRENNMFYISDSITIKILGSCPNCGLLKVWTWKVFRGDGQEVILDHITTTTGKNKANLVLRKNVLDNNYAYTFELKVTNLVHKHPGFARIILQPIKPPHGGFCTLRHPDHKEVVALKDLLTIVCDGWQGNIPSSLDPLQYHIFVEDSKKSSLQKTRNWYPIYKGTQKISTFFLSPFAEETSDVELYVHVIDYYGLKTEAFHKRITVTAMQPLNSTRMEALMFEVYRNLPLVAGQNKPSVTQQYIILLLLHINGEAALADPYISSLGDSDKEEREKMRHELLRVMNTSVPITALQDVQQMAFSLYLITSYVEEFPKNETLYVVVTDLLQSIIQILSPKVSQGWEGDEFVPVYLLATVGNLIEVIHMELSKSPGVIQLTRSEHNRDSLEAAVEIMDSILYLLLQTQVANEEPYTFETQYLYSVGVRTKANQIYTEYQKGKSRVVFPNKLLKDMHEEEVFQIISTITTNPYIWGLTDGMPITSEVVSVAFTFINGTEVKLSDLPDDRSITIGFENSLSDEDIHADTVEEAGMSPSFVLPLLLYNSSDFWDGKVNSVLVSPESSLSTKLDYSKNINSVLAVLIAAYPQVLWPQNMKPRYVDMAIYVAKGYIPDSAKYDYMTQFNANQEAPATPHDNYTVFIRESQWTSDEPYYMTVTNFDTRVTVNLSTAVVVGLCKFYNTESGLWESQGCQPTLHSQGWLDCKCNHLTPFGATAVPVTVGMKFFVMQGSSVVVTICVSIVAVMFVGLVLLTRYWDLLDQRRLAIVPLCGRDGLYKYEVTIVTGTRPGAGTSANVAIRLFGDTSNSRSKHLSHPGAFTRNSVDVFLVAMDTSLGNVNKIQIWHDNSGLSPAWYLSYIIVKDFQNGSKKFFICNKWLSLGQEDSKISLDLDAADDAKLASLKTQFSAELPRCISEHHLWHSVVGRPAYSRVTRVQRLLLCTATILVYMGAASIWYAVMYPVSGIRNEEAVSLDDAIVGCSVAIGFYPIVVILYAVFNYSKIKPRVSDLPRPLSAQTVEMDNLVDLNSRNSSASTYRGRPELIHLQNLDRESTGDSLLQAQAGKLHRSDPLKVVREESLDDLLKDTAVPDDALSLSPSVLTSNQAGQRDAMWWSYDSILRWPERLPHAAPEGTESRQTSASSSQRPHRIKVNSIQDDSLKESIKRNQDVGPNGKTSTNFRKLSQRRFSCTNTIDELLDELDFWDSDDPTDTPSKETDSSEGDSGVSNTKDISEENEKNHKIITKENFDPREEATLADQVLKQFDEEESETACKPPRKKTLKEKSEISNEQHAEAKQKMNLSRNVANKGDKGDCDTKGKGEDGKENDTAAEHTLQRKRTLSLSSDTSHSHGDKDRRPSVSWSEIMPAYHKDRSWSNASESTISRVQYFSATNNTHTPWCQLPHWCVYINYISCAVIIVVAMAVIIFRGMHISMTTSMSWLLSVGISMLLSILVLEPVKVLVVATFNSMQHNTLDIDIHRFLQPMLEIDQAYKDKKLRPLGGYALLQAKEEARKVAQLRALIKSFVANVLYLLLVLSINYTAFYYSGHQLNTHLHNDFLLTPASNGLTFSHVRNYSEFWLWMEEVGAQVLHREQLQPQATHVYGLGVARLIQARSLPVACPASGALTDGPGESLVDRNCYAQDGPWQTDTFQNHPNSSWSYESASDLHSIPYEGHLGTYDGGGYVRLLGDIFSETLLRLNLLQNLNWINRGTRAVFLEYSAYSVNTKLYAAVRLVFEFSTTGGVITSKFIDVFKFSTKGDSTVVAIGFCQVLLVAVAIYQLISIIQAMRRLHLQFLTSFWHWVELLLLALSWASVLVYIMMLVEDARLYPRVVDALHTSMGQKLNSHPSLLRSVQLRNLWSTLIAFMLFLMVLVVARQLRFIRPLSVFGRTLCRASPKLTGCAIIFILLSLTYSLTANQWYGFLVYAFKDIGKGISSMVVMVRGNAPFLDTMATISPAFTTIFLMSWMFLVLITLMGLIIGVLVDSFKMVRQEMFYHNTLETQDYEMVDILIKHLKRWMGIIKPKPAFRKVQFRGMPSLSTDSSSITASSSYRSRSLSSTSDDCHLLEMIDENASKKYHQELLLRALPTWELMLDKLDKVVSLDDCENRLTEGLQVAAQSMLQNKPDDAKESLPPVPPPRKRRTSQGKMKSGKAKEHALFLRSRSLSASKMTLKQPPEIVDSLYGKRPSSTGTVVKGARLMEETSLQDEEDMLTPVEDVIGRAKNAW